MKIANRPTRRPAPMPARALLGATLVLPLLCPPVSAAPAADPPIALNRIPAALKPYALAPGQRLHRPGKERILASGTIAFPEDGRMRSEPVRIAWQYPMKLRLDRGGSPMVFDGKKPRTATAGARGIADAARSLLEDSVEGFFALQDGGGAMRTLGSGFRMEGTGDADPAMDVVLLECPDPLGGNEPVLKSYWFDSGTRLLGVVAYATSPGVATYTVLGDWRDVEGERIPFRIERWQNNEPIIRLELEAASVAAADDDGLFGGE